MASGVKPPSVQEDKLVSQARSLALPLREKWASVLGHASNRLSATPSSDPKALESSLEDFYALCDQMELHLKAAEACLQQTVCSTRYMPIMPSLNRMEQVVSVGQAPDFLTYGQFISKSKQHAQFARDVRHVLQQATGHQHQQVQQQALLQGQGGLQQQQQMSQMQQQMLQQQQQMQQQQQLQQQFQQRQRLHAQQSQQADQMPQTQGQLTQQQLQQQLQQQRMQQQQQLQQQQLQQQQLRQRPIQ